MRLGNTGLAVSTDDIENGKWFDLPEFQTKGITPRLKLRSCDSELYRLAATRLKMSSLTGDALLDAVRSITSEVLICGWEGFLTSDGTPLPYTAETCAAVCSNPDNRRLISRAFQIASSDHRYDVAYETPLTEEDSKN